MYNLFYVKYHQNIRSNGPLGLNFYSQIADRKKNYAFQGSFILHLPTFHLLGFCWDDHSRPTQEKFNQHQTASCDINCIDTV